MPINLGKLDGRDVVATKVAVTNAGDGLSAALAIDPQVMHIGDEMYLALRVVVGKVRFEPVEPHSDELVRVHVLKAQDASLVPASVVGEHIDAQRRRIEEAQGITRLSLEEPA